MKGYKYRIYPNAEQSEIFAQHFGTARFVYNTALEMKKRYYDQYGKGLSKRAIQDQFVALKKTEEFDWLNTINSQSILAALGNVHTAYQNFFRGNAEFPKFKKKYSGWQSFQCPQHVTIDFENGLINLPKIKEGIKINFHREFEGEIKTVTIKRTPTGKYTATILVDDGVENPIRTTIDPGNSIGIDIGITHFLIDSEGGKIENPKILKQSLDRLAIEQRKLSRKKDGSANRAKQKRVVAQVHETVANKRYDFIQQQSAKLAINSQVTSFAVEDLNIKGMVKNRKLSRAISDCGWGMFLKALQYKCDWNGKNLLKIDRFAPSSKTCSACGTKVDKLPLSIREWQCDCGAKHDRDINAAKNIRAFALAEAQG